MKLSISKWLIPCSNVKQHRSWELRWTFYRHLTNDSNRCPERSDCRYPLFPLTRVMEHGTGTRNVTWQSVVWRYLLHVAAPAVPFLVHTSGFCCSLLQRKEALSWSWIESKPDKRIKYQIKLDKFCEHLALIWKKHFPVPKRSLRDGQNTGPAGHFERFHMTSRCPHWSPKTMKRRPCWCAKPVL